MTAPTDRRKQDAKKTQTTLHSYLGIKSSMAFLCPSPEHTKKINNIRQIQLFHFSVPLTQTLKFKHHSLTTREGLIIKVIFKDNNIGIGEASPLPGFSIENLSEVTTKLIAFCDQLTNEKVSENKTNKLETAYQSLPASAQFALDCALQKIAPLEKADDDGRNGDTDIKRTKQQTVPLLIADNVQSALMQYQQLGKPRRVKLKVARSSIEKDSDIICALVAENSEVSLNLDANQSWTFEQASNFIIQLPEQLKANIHYIEEPCIDIKQNLTFAKQTNTPIALDESLLALLISSEINTETYSEQLVTLLSDPLIHSIVLKPSLIGSLDKLAQIITIAKQTNTQVYLSSSFESMIGNRQLQQLAREFHLVGEHGFDTLKFMHNHQELLELFNNSKPIKVDIETDSQAKENKSNFSLELLWKS